MGKVEREMVRGDFWRGSSYVEWDLYGEGRISCEERFVNVLTF